ncbi:hypothetical protein POM88_042031 [Heracleum sosnowskyi]|uniref:Uncharacterized protein n=1 Tax=Heracleum sosnowskyi TaxID=360622 RepID=A0AAD8HFD3_9APIA|nr:hypothetical protein POM88_042031 [Heracleum sosnowskyi]
MFSLYADDKSCTFVGTAAYVPPEVLNSSPATVGMGQYKDAIPLLERSIEIPDMDEGQKHALAKFTGCMQLGDTYAMLGLIENSILCYTAGLEIQEQVLGEKDLRLGETCRYVAEAHVQMLQFAEAEEQFL